MCVCLLHHLALRLDPVKREIYGGREEDIVWTSISSSMRPPLHYLTQAIDPHHTHTRSHSSVSLSPMDYLQSIYIDSLQLSLDRWRMLLSKHLFEIIICWTKCHNCPVGLCLIGLNEWCETCFDTDLLVLATAEMLTYEQNSSTLSGIFRKITDVIT